MYYWSRTVFYGFDNVDDTTTEIWHFQTRRLRPFYGSLLSTVVSFSKINGTYLHLVDNNNYEK